MSLTSQTKGMVYRTYVYYLQYGDLGMVYDIVLPTFMGMIRGLSWYNEIIFYMFVGF